MEDFMNQMSLDTLSDFSFVNGALDDAGIARIGSDGKGLRSNKRVWILIEQRNSLQKQLTDAQWVLKEIEFVEEYDYDHNRYYRRCPNCHGIEKHRDQCELDNALNKKGE